MARCVCMCVCVCMCIYVCIDTSSSLLSLLPSTLNPPTHPPRGDLRFTRLYLLLAAVATVLRSTTAMLWPVIVLAHLGRRGDSRGRVMLEVVLVGYVCPGHWSDVICGCCCVSL